MFTGFLLAGIVQIPLTLTNAVIATTTLIKDYFPDKEVSSRSLMLNMGVMNTVTSFFSGIPLCHGGSERATRESYGNISVYFCGRFFRWYIDGRQVNLSIWRNVYIIKVLIQWKSYV